MEIDEFVRRIEGSLPGVTAGTLRPETRFRELPTWDSLAALTTLSAIDEALSVQLPADQFRACNTLRDLWDAAGRQKRA